MCRLDVRMGFLSPIIHENVPIITISSIMGFKWVICD